MSTPHAPVRPEQALRDSGAAGPHPDRRERRARTRQTRDRRAREEQER